MYKNKYLFSTIVNLILMWTNFSISYVARQRFSTARTGRLNEIETVDMIEIVIQSETEHGEGN